MKELKKHLSLTGQVDLLMSRGLIVRDKQAAMHVLSNINYYRFTGYLHGFKVKQTGKYREETTFEEIHSLYSFDQRFTRILMFALEDIEETLKTRLSYTLTQAFPEDPLIYLQPKIYRNGEDFTRFQAYFAKEVDNNKKLPFIKHHIDQYGGQLPMWVAVEIMTMGNIHALYKNLQAPYQKEIAATYKTGVVQLSSWIQNLTYTRNHLAHYMRIYDFNFGRTPAQCNKHHKYTKTTGKIFDQIYVMSFMYSDAMEWNNYILPEIEELLQRYSVFVKLDALGFPPNWKEILTKRKNAP